MFTVRTWLSSWGLRWSGSPGVFNSQSYLHRTSSNLSMTVVLPGLVLMPEAVSAMGLCAGRLQICLLACLSNLRAVVCPVFFPLLLIQEELLIFQSVQFFTSQDTVLASEFVTFGTGIFKSLLCLFLISKEILPREHPYNFFSFFVGQSCVTSQY